jgi:hypothetical protein
MNHGGIWSGPQWIYCDSCSACNCVATPFAEIINGPMLTVRLCSGLLVRFSFVKTLENFLLRISDFCLLSSKHHFVLINTILSH